MEGNLIRPISLISGSTTRRGPSGRIACFLCHISGANDRTFAAKELVFVNSHMFCCYPSDDFCGACYGVL